MLFITSSFIVNKVSVSKVYIDKRLTVLLFCSAFFAPFAVFLLSVYGPVSLWADRQLIGPGVLFIVLVGLGLSVHRYWPRMMLISTLSLWCLLSLPLTLPDRYEREPWRHIVTLMDQLCSGCDFVVAQEPHELIRPLAYYSDYRVYGWSEYRNHSVRAERIGFVCRPILCDELNQIQSEYEILQTESINWSRVRSPSKVVQIVVLQRGGTNT
jgi:hypothetical protein